MPARILRFVPTPVRPDPEQRLPESPCRIQIAPPWGGEPRTLQQQDNERFEQDSDSRPHHPATEQRSLTPEELRALQARQQRPRDQPGWDPHQPYDVSTDE